MQSIPQGISLTIEDTLELYPDECGAPPFDPRNEKEVSQLFDYHITNHMPAHLIYIGDSEMRIVGRGELSKLFEPRKLDDDELNKIRSSKDAIRELVKPALKYAIFRTDGCARENPLFRISVTEGNAARMGFRSCQSSARRRGNLNTGWHGRIHVASTKRTTRSSMRLYARCSIGIVMQISALCTSRTPRIRSR